MQVERNGKTWWFKRSEITRVGSVSAEPSTGMDIDAADDVSSDFAETDEEGGPGVDIQIDQAQIDQARAKSARGAQAAEAAAAVAAERATKAAEEARARNAVAAAQPAHFQLRQTHGPALDCPVIPLPGPTTLHTELVIGRQQTPGVAAAVSHYTVQTQCG